MQHHNEGRGNEQKGKNSRGSVRNADRLAAFAGRGEEGSADWGACDPNLLQAVVVGITGLGGAITIGLSRDQGAHSLTLLLDGARKTLWFNGDADLSAAMREVLGVLEAMA